MNFTAKELNRLWGLFFLLSLEAENRGDLAMAAFFSNERRAIMDKRVQLMNANQPPRLPRFPFNTWFFGGPK